MDLKEKRIMKELSIEEKAKAYDEALEKARNWYIDCQLNFKKALEELFPELKESEDERIRKEIISALKYANHKGVYDKHLAWLEKQGKEEYSLKSFKDEDVRKFMQCIEKQAKAYEINLPNRTYDIYAFAKDILTWLEKQGQPFTKKDVDDAYLKGIIDAKNELEKQGEQKYAPVLDIEIPFGAKDSELQEASYHIPDGYHAKIEGNRVAIKRGEQKPYKVEPKFKVGNWYQCIKDFFDKGVTFDKNTAYYCAKEGCLQDEYGCHIAIVKDLYDNFKLWTIQDAKPGDILSCKDDIVIFKSNNYNPETQLGCMCTYSFLNERYCCWGEIGGINPTDFHPASSEERNKLFDIMKSGGYEWDAEKKELKKIKKDDCKPDDFIEESYQQQADDLINIVTEKPTWSEEDEEMLKMVIKSCEQCGNEYAYYWLKSLKERVQPQNTWKPSNEQMKALDNALSIAKNCGEESAFDLRTLYEQLKKLRKK